MMSVFVSIMAARLAMILSVTMNAGSNGKTKKAGRGMKIRYGTEKTEYGPGVEVLLDGNEVATAIDSYLVAHGIVVSGPRTITINGDLCDEGRVYVDPSGFVITPAGDKMEGRGCKCCLDCQESQVGDE